MSASQNLPDKAFASLVHAVKFQADVHDRSGYPGVAATLREAANTLLRQQRRIVKLQTEIKDLKHRPRHDLEKCLACDTNIDVCCGNWFYGDTEDGIKVHKRCEKRWARIAAEINTEDEIEANAEARAYANA